MAKRKYRFGLNYLLNQPLGIAVIQGERFYWVTDGYTRWRLVDFDPTIGAPSAKFVVWPR